MVHSLGGMCQSKSIEGCCHQKIVNGDAPVVAAADGILNHWIDVHEEEAFDFYRDPCFRKGLGSGR